MIGFTPFIPVNVIQSAQVTSSDLLRRLIEKVDELRKLEVATEEARIRFEGSSETRAPGSTTFGEYWDRAVAEQATCEEEIIAFVKILAGRGALEQCRDILHAETAGRA